MCFAVVVFVLQFAGVQLEDLIYFGYVCAAIIHEMDLGQVGFHEFVFEPTIAVWLEVVLKYIFALVPLTTVLVFSQALQGQPVKQTYTASILMQIKPSG
jgi:hypothetical protein